MEQLQNAELHENIKSVTFGDSLESVNQPKTQKKKADNREAGKEFWNSTPSALGSAYKN